MGKESSGEIKRLSGYEYDAMLKSLAVHVVIDDKAVCELSRRVKNGYRDYRLIQVKLDKLIGDELGTVPMEQLQRLRKHINGSEIKLATRTITKPNDEGWFIDTDELITLIEAAMDGQCDICDGDAHKCKLRKVLRNMPIEMVRARGIGCISKGIEG